MIKIAAINKPIQLAGMTIGVGADGKLCLNINPREAVAQTFQAMITNLSQALMPLVQQGVELPDVKLPEQPPADPVEHFSAIVAFVAIDGLKKMVAMQRQAEKDAKAKAAAQDDQGGIAPAANDVAGIEKATAGAATADSGAEPVAATADAAAAPASQQPAPATVQ